MDVGGFVDVVDIIVVVVLVLEGSYYMISDYIP